VQTPKASPRQFSGSCNEARAQQGRGTARRDPLAWGPAAAKRRQIASAPAPPPGRGPRLPRAPHRPCVGGGEVCALLAATPILLAAAKRRKNVAGGVSRRDARPPSHEQPRRRRKKERWSRQSRPIGLMSPMRPILLGQRRRPRWLKRRVAYAAVRGRCFLRIAAGKPADREGQGRRPLRLLWRAASRCPVHRYADGQGGWSGP